jgi:hypothetical protein
VYLALPGAPVHGGARRFFARRAPFPTLHRRRARPRPPRARWGARDAKKHNCRALGRQHAPAGDPGVVKHADALRRQPSPAAVPAAQRVGRLRRFCGRHATWMAAFDPGSCRARASATVRASRAARRWRRRAAAAQQRGDDLLLVRSHAAVRTASRPRCRSQLRRAPRSCRRAMQLSCAPAAPLRSAARPLADRASRPSCRRAPRVVTTALANTFGTAFRVTTFGESHGGGVGCVVDGVPPRLQLSNAELQARPARAAQPRMAMSPRRRSARSALTRLLSLTLRANPAPRLRSLSWTAAGRGRAASPRRATRRTRARSCQVRPATTRPQHGAVALTHPYPHSLFKASRRTGRRWARPSPCWFATRTSAAATTARCRCVRRAAAPRTPCLHSRHVRSPALALTLCVQVAYRPSHADATYDMKYGVRAIAVRPSRGRSARLAQTLMPLRSPGRRPLVRARDHRPRGRRRHRQEDLGAGGWR